jgi:hypothetical protein
MNGKTVTACVEEIRLLFKPGDTADSFGRPPVAENAWPPIFPDPEIIKAPNLARIQKVYKNYTATTPQFCHLITISPNVGFWQADRTLELIMYVCRELPDLAIMK